MDLNCILISPVGQVDRAALMAGLGYANARYEGVEAGEDIFTLEPTKFGIAQIGDCLVLIDIDIVSDCFHGTQPHDSMRALISAFPEAEIGSFTLLSNDNSWGYSVISKGKMLGRKFGDSNNGTTIDEGISPQK